MNVLEVSFALGSSTSLSIKFGALVHNELGLRAPSPVDIGHEWRKRVLGPEDPVTRGRSGVLLKLKWLRSLDPPCPWNKRACSEAIRGGHLAVLQWLKQEGCPWYEDAVSLAARSGRIEILEWLRSEGEVFDERACDHAAMQGDRYTLAWLRSLDPPCPWNKSRCRMLADRWSSSAEFAEPEEQMDVILDLVVWIEEQEE